MRKIHTHTALLILAAAVTILVGGIYGYMYTAVSASVERAVLARDIVRVEEANKNHSQDIVEIYESTAKGRSEVRGAFIPADKVVAFIEAIEGLGSKAGSVVEISAINADNMNGQAANTLGAVHAHVEAVGSWSAVMRTLILAEVLPYKITIEDVRLDSGSSEGKGGREWMLSFDLQAALIVPVKPAN